MQENIHECSKALEDGNALQITRWWSTKSRAWNISKCSTIEAKCYAIKFHFVIFHTKCEEGKSFVETMT
jgi:hypothetical protein